MLRRSVVVILLTVASTFAAIWHEPAGGHRLKATESVQPPGNPLVWKELGLKEAEQADLGSFRITAYDMQDVTGAVAAQEWLAATDPNATQVGNFVLTCFGKCPMVLDKYMSFLPVASGGAPPTLPGYLPQQGLIKGTERYVLGSATLAEFAPFLPQATVGLQLSPEADLARYRTRAGEATLSVLSYPTPQIARQQADGFRKLNGAFVKRSGPLVAIVTGIADKNAAWDLLNQVNYEVQVTMNDAAKHNQVKSLANMILSIFALAGILIGFCLVSGLLFAGGRVVLQRFGILTAHEAMTALHLSDG